VAAELNKREFKSRSGAAFRPVQVQHPHQCRHGAGAADQTPRRFRIRVKAPTDTPALGAISL
jgi:hypothetical protein